MKSKTELLHEQNELNKQRRDIQDQKAERVKDLSKKEVELTRKLYEINKELSKIKKYEKKGKPHNGMNLILTWDNGRYFDSRKNRYSDLLNLIFNNGVPQDMEMRP